MATIISRADARKQDDDLLLFPEAEHLAPVRVGGSPAAESWLNNVDEEGRLAIDVIETEKEIVIMSPIAGVKPENLEVFMHNDMLTIRGTRHADAHAVSEGKQIVKECHWGSFSRSIILPIEIDADAIAATIRDGVLTVRMPKIERSKRIAVKQG
jgi:HSP20 family protein